MFSTLYDPAEACGLRAETKLWFDAPPWEFANSYIEAFESMVEPIKDRFNFYRTHNMPEWKKPTARTLASPKTWVTRVRQDAARSLFLRESFRSVDVAKCGVETSFQGLRAQFYGANADFLRQVLPAEEFDNGAAALLERALELGNHVPFLCGYVGYVVEISPLLGSVIESEGHQAAIGLSTRHPGATISGLMSTGRLRLYKGVDQVSWLTMVGATPLKTLGGADSVKETLAAYSDISVHDVEHGIVIQAGDRPMLGDVNRGDDLPLYRVVYAALQSVLEPELEHVRALRLRTDDDHQRTLDWYRRFAE